MAEDIITGENTETQEVNSEIVTENREGRIVRINIEEEMKSAYIDYAMSVIVARALPDVRDGMKPVHRRIMFGMSNELGLYSDKPHRKSARIVGDVMGKFHPHGDSSIYDAMVRMAQPWSLRYPLVDGQGNFGSMDGDQPAAMRYTEARMRKIADEVMSDIDKDTVDFIPNFDETTPEPTVLPSRVPLLLVNGSVGIAVGMATNMAPHNLTEVCDAVCAYIDNPDIDTDGLMQYVKAPDFPTGGTIYGYSGVREAFETGRGRVVIRAKTDIEVSSSGRETIVVTEIPYMVNKAEMIQKIAALINDKKIEGISYINDESDRNGMRIPIVLKKDANASVVLNMLFKQSQLQTSFSVNNVALVDGRPMTLNLKELIHYFVEHRHRVVVRRTKYELAQAEKRTHILKGLLIALDNIDEIVSIIRSSATPDEAKTRMMAQFALDEIQAGAIIDMRLRALTGLERGRLEKEYAELMARIERYNQILGSTELQLAVVKEETEEIKAKYGDTRRTEIEMDADDFNPEDFYADDDMVITISHLGYIKRTPLSEFRAQRRGGKGVKGSATREEDFIEHIYMASMHSTLILFTERGRCYWLKVYNIPEGARNSKGRAIQNVIQIDPNDKVKAYITVKKLDDKEFVDSHYVIMGTRNGYVKKMNLAAFSHIRKVGVNAIDMREGDELLDAVLTDGQTEIILATREGMAVRFNESTIRAVASRSGMGMIGTRITGDNAVVGMLCMKAGDGKDILVLSANGLGKRSDLDDYRLLANRGGKGVRTLKVTDKTGALVSIQAVSDEDDLMIITQNGVLIRTSVEALRIMGRNTQGVKIINIYDGDSIASVTVVPKEDEEEIEVETEKTN